MSAVALARALGELLADPPRRRAMGLAGRELVATEFALGAMLDAYELLYREPPRRR